MSSKKDIIKSIRSSNLPKVELDDFGLDLTVYKDKVKAFKDSFVKAGGKIVDIKEDALCQEIFKIIKDDKTVSYIDDCELSSSTFKSAKELKDVDTVIFRSHLGVCENGAIWCDDKDIDFRAIYFIVKKLIIVLYKSNLVDTMHEAYKKIKTDDISFGLFLSGPSKTADIEQSLVIGAHGAIECQLLLIDS